jgi:hypothetical protein
VIRIVGCSFEIRRGGCSFVTNNHLS